MMHTALAIEGLTITDAAGQRLVDGVSLSLPRGGVLTLIGETGSGKSLIAQACFGLLPAGLRVSGHIRIGDGPALAAGDRAGLMRHWREQIMLVPQEPGMALDPTMRIGRQMALAGVAEPAQPAALAGVDLPSATARQFPFTLSGGMAQRVLVATALGTGAPIIVADEPTKGLDADRVTQATALLRQVAQAGRSLLVITHDRRVAAELGGAVAILRDGRIVEQGPAASTLAAPQSDYARAWLAADPATWQPCRRCCDMQDLALTAHGLAFGWPGRPALFRDVDIHLPRGGVLALTGPSGSGKTTLGNVLLALLPPTAGTVEWGGIDPHRDARGLARLRQRYQKLHQDPATAFLPRRAIGPQLAALERVRPGLRVASALPPILDRLKLRPALLARGPEDISGGEAQRLALARLLLLDPAVIVADEPTSRLDPIVQRETMALLRQCVSDQGLALILISHDAALVAATADEVLAIA
jgi:peptide/nickel transport system ATP-binding protein